MACSLQGNRLFGQGQALANALANALATALAKALAKILVNTFVQSIVCAMLKRIAGSGPGEHTGTRRSHLEQGWLRYITAHSSQQLPSKVSLWAERVLSGCPSCQYRLIDRTGGDMGHTSSPPLPPSPSPPPLSPSFPLPLHFPLFFSSLPPLSPDTP